MERPITNLAIIGVEYASKSGVFFDNGDLWKIADSIRQELRRPE